MTSELIIASNSDPSDNSDKQRATETEREAAEALLLLSKPLNRGALCSRSGLRYETQIAQFSRGLSFQGHPVSCSDPAGSGSGNDLTLTVMLDGTTREIGLEAKRPTPDWMQVKLSHQPSSGDWVVATDLPRSKIPSSCRDYYRQLFGTRQFWDGKLPSFTQGDITWEQWSQERSNFPDQYLECPEDTIRNLYRRKGCHYIQIDGKGLYHLGDDPLGLGVPSFSCPQRLRIRCKIHDKKNSRGYANLSVTMATQPISLSQLADSSYSLDGQGVSPPVFSRL